VHRKLNERFKIITNSLLVNEFNRRKEQHFKEALKCKSEIKVKTSYPILFTDQYDDFEELKEEEKKLKEAAKNFNLKYDKLMKKLRDKYLNNQLYTDDILNEIFRSSTHIEISTEIIEKAKSRLDLNNPPGKINQLGDRIHWESLLSGVEDGHKLIIISTDGDFFSLINNDQINPVLSREWMDVKKSSIEIFRSLTDFLKVYLPEFELPDELAAEIKEKIKALNDSSSFFETHNRIADLNRHYKDLTWNHIKSIIHSYKRNSQIYGILEDEDVNKFIMSLQQHPHYTSALDDEFSSLLNSR
ncbi:TPA: DUF4935 domain-containing protein, partial [Legionella pneumophila]|nr:DUF4935 domain-containing protein [Legionella pneumophila]